MTYDQIPIQKHISTATLEQEIMQELPKWVLKTKLKLGEDHCGEDSLFVTFVISRKKPKIFKDAKQLLAIEKPVRAILEKHGVTLFPYFRFLSETDVPKNALPTT